MSYLNSGVRETATGKRVPTKKALKELIKNDPASVTFDPTSPLDRTYPFTGDAIPAGVRVQVVGPDPFEKRNWYSTVEVTAKGVKVS